MLDLHKFMYRQNGLKVLLNKGLSGLLLQLIQSKQFVIDKSLLKQSTAKQLTLIEVKLCR